MHFSQINKLVDNAPEEWERERNREREREKVMCLTLGTVAQRVAAKLTLTN